MEATVAELRRQVLAGHRQMQELSQEVGRISTDNQRLAADNETLNRKVNHLHQEAQGRDVEIRVLKAASGNGGGGGNAMNLINVKSMAPRVFEGKPNDSFRT